MEKNRQLHQTKGYIMIAMAGILWGTIGLFVSLLKSLGAESELIVVIRIGTATILLIPLMLASGGPALFKADKQTIIACIAMGIFSQALFNYAYSESINKVGVATGAVLLYTSPIFVSVMSRIVFKEQVGKIKILALFINIIGCTLTVTGGTFTSVKFSVYGVAMGVTAGFLYALMTIISTPVTEKNHPLTIVFYQFLFGTITMALITHPFAGVSQLISLKFVLAAIGYGLIPTVGSYFFYMHGLSHGLETSKVPVVASVETVVAAVIGIFVFSEDMSLFKLAGIVLVLLSIVIMNMVKPKKKV